ncbi:hypothetical protein [Sphingobacterium sp. SYP-B4668]|uniref:hypothetical protein n=1 Tax=Sphingobacterium sp. SYP-B4668 TaxID=2996035 RepID=UPI0022DE54B5|nr:hypothetical protein [Sphingobacterium sp. SYP-B4668]
MLETIDHIIGERNFITGKVFYNIANITKTDIDFLCDLFFSKYKWEIILNLDNAKTKLQAFLMIFSNSSNNISKSSGVEKSRLSRLQNGELKELYADEIFGLAKSLGTSPRLLFEYLYGEGKKLVLKLELVDGK